MAQLEARVAQDLLDFLSHVSVFRNPSALVKSYTVWGRMSSMIPTTLYYLNHSRF